MFKRIFHCLLILCLAFVFSGCLIRTYSVRKDRVDQEVSGNRGYLQGASPADEEVQPQKKRKTFVIEFEMSSPFREKEEKKGMETDEIIEESGNLGYVTGGPQEDYSEAVYPYEREEVNLEVEDNLVAELGFVEYEVQEGDTLQKISKKFYGTYRKWKKIYDANEGAIKDPNRIKPGMIILVPEE